MGFMRLLAVYLGLPAGSNRRFTHRATIQEHVIFLSAVAQYPVYYSMLSTAADSVNPKLAGCRGIELPVYPVKFRFSHGLNLTRDHQFFDFGNRLGRV